MKKDYREIEGWCEEEITFLYDKAIESVKDQAIFVELGCYKGRSTCYMIDAIQRSNKKIDFYVVDNFSTLGNVEQEFRENLGEERLERMTLINHDSIEASRFFKDSSVDFIFIDTVHAAERLVAELNSWDSKLKKGSLVSGHDWHLYDTKDAFDILKISSYNVILSPIQQKGDSVWRYTSWWYTK